MYYFWSEMLMKLVTGWQRFCILIKKDATNCIYNINIHAIYSP